MPQTEICGIFIMDTVNRKGLSLALSPVVTQKKAGL